jgi:hypothetical protein
MDQPNKSSERSIIFFVLLLAITPTVWPSYRAVTLAGISAITRPFANVFGKIETKGPVPALTEARKKRLKEEKLALQARSMEFRAQQYHI